jgi:hypothetical protein
MDRLSQFDDTRRFRLPDSYHHSKMKALTLFEYRKPPLLIQGQVNKVVFEQGFSMQCNEIR